MRRWDSQHGGGKLGCLFSLLLISIFIYLVYKIAPVYYHASEFETGAEQQVGRAAAKYVGDAVLKKNLMNLAAVQQIPLKEKDLKIIRAASQLAVEIKYAITVDLIVTRHTFHFQFRARSVIGAL